MPLYVYQAIEGSESCGQCGPGFEIHQKLSDAKLEHCPECGHTIQKIIGNISIGSRMMTKTDPDRAAKLGFTTYRKAEKGVYEKTAGPGPKRILK